MERIAHTIHRRLDEIPEWNEVAAGGGFYASAEFLAYAERGPERYLALREAGRTVAVACALAAPRGPLLPATSDPGTLLPGEPDPALYPVLYCGSARAWAGGLLVRPGLDGEARGRALAALLGALRELAAKEGARTIAFGFVSADEALALAAIDRSLVPAFAQSEAAIGPLTTFEAYLGAMTSARRRASRLEMERFAARVRFERRRLSEVLAPFAALMPAWVAKYGQAVNADYVRRSLERLIELGLDGETRVLCAYDGETLLGGSLCIRHQATWYARNFVLAESAPKEAAIYFNLSFYRAVAEAIAEGATAIHCGVNTIEEKVARGARVKPLWFVLDGEPARSREVRRALAAASRERLAREAALLAPYRRGGAARAELALDQAERLLAEAE